MKFWLLAALICFLAALASLGLKILLESPGQSEFKHYQPVDVPPAELSPRHDRERIEIETKGMSEQEKKEYLSDKTPETD